MTSTDWRFDLTTMTLLLATIAVLAGGQVLFKLSANGLQLGDPRTFLSVPLVAARRARRLHAGTCKNGDSTKLRVPASHTNSLCAVTSPSSTAVTR